MGRRQKLNKSPTTSISVSVDLRDTLGKSRPRSKTMDEFLCMVFSEWQSLKEIKEFDEFYKREYEEGLGIIKKYRPAFLELQKLGLVNDDGSLVKAVHDLIKAGIIQMNIK